MGQYEGCTGSSGLKKNGKTGYYVKYPVWSQEMPEHHIIAYMGSN